jgi:hypothetical protein
MENYLNLYILCKNALIAKVCIPFGKLTTGKLTIASIETEYSSGQFSSGQFLEKKIH